MELLPNDMGGSIKDRMNQLIQVIEPKYPESIDIAFASQLGGLEEVSPEERRFNALWIFTDRYIGEIRNPLANGQKLNFEVAILTDNVDYIRLGSQDYDLQKATEKSQLTLEFTTADGLNGTISAIGNGCDDLMRVYDERLKANLYKRTDT